MMGRQDAEACSICGKPVSFGRICSTCTIGITGSSSPSVATKRIGQYELLQVIGAGGMGNVYLARSQAGTLLALKTARTDRVDTPVAAAIFRRELAAAQELSHPNIVRIHNLASDNNRPYLVMDLLAGTLGALQPWSDASAPDYAIYAMLKVAHAVHHAHRCGILHCDLKPSNILVDEEAEPFVSDFGLARALFYEEELHNTMLSGGSRGWMAPEQVRSEAPTTATDMFCLGLLFHWMLTGEHAFGCDEASARRVQFEEPAPLLDAKFSWELRCISRRALEKEVARRYPSVGDFAHDLENLLHGRPIDAEKQSTLRKASKWVRRHLFGATLAVEMLLLLVCVALVPLTVVDDLEQLIRSNNLYAAQVQAGAVANELRIHAEEVLRLARIDELLRELSTCDATTPSKLLSKLERDFDSVWLFDNEGIPCRSWPLTNTKLEPTYNWRDYFIGQQRLAETGAASVYIARIVRDDVDSELKLVYATPVFDAAGKPRGALAATTMTRSTFGSVQMNCSGKGNCMTALLGPRDRDTRQEPRNDEKRLTVVAEPGLVPGAQVVVPTDLSARICARLGCTPWTVGALEPSDSNAAFLEEHFRDPMDGQYSLAGIAAVAHTGMSVVVATPRDSIVALGSAFGSRLKHMLWLPLVTGALVIAGAVAITALGGRRVRKWQPRKRN